MKPVTAAEARARERILTQAEPAKISESADSVVLHGGDLFLVASEGGDVPLALFHAYGLFFREASASRSCSARDSRISSS